MNDSPADINDPYLSLLWCRCCGVVVVRVCVFPPWFIYFHCLPLPFEPYVSAWSVLNEVYVSL